MTVGRVWPKTSLWGQPMGDGRRFRRVRKRPNPVETILIVHGDTLVLAEVLVPGSDDILLDNPVGISRVLPDAPRGCTGAAAAEASGFQCGNHLFGVALSSVVVDADQHGTYGLCIHGQCGLRPITCRHEILRGDRLKSVAETSERTERKRYGVDENRPGQTEVLRRDAQNGASECVPTLEHDEVIGHARALTHCGSDSWKSELRVDSANIQAAPPTTRQRATTTVTWT